MKYIKIIIDLRENNDLMQQQLADVLGTFQTMYARYERVANEFSVRHLIKLCKFLVFLLIIFSVLMTKDDEKTKFFSLLNEVKVMLSHLASIKK